MENVVSINHTKASTLEFDLTTEGVETKDIVVKFMIEAKGMEIGFQAKKKKGKDAGDSWSVKLPALPMLEKTAYTYCIEVHSDGYFFEPLKGTLNVVGSAEIYSTAPKNPTLKSADSKDEKKPAAKKKATEAVQTKPVRAREKGIEQIAQELMENKANQPKPAPKKKAATPEKPQRYTEPLIKKTEQEIVEEEHEGTKDQQVLAILEEVGIKPKSRGKRPRISFIKQDMLDD